MKDPSLSIYRDSLVNHNVIYCQAIMQILKAN